MNKNDAPQLTPSDIDRIREWIVEWHEKRNRALAETEHSTYRVFGLEGLLADKAADLLATIETQAAEIARLRAGYDLLRRQMKLQFPPEDLRDTIDTVMGDDTDSEVRS